MSGDLGNPGTLDGAFEGVEVMYLIASGDRIADVVSIAAASGVGRIVTLSSASAGFVDNDGGKFHRDFETIVESSGLAWTHIRPGMFASNLLDWAPSIKSTRAVRAPHEASRQAPVHERDVAAVAAAAVLDAAHAGKIYTLSGPQSLTKREQVEAISAALGETIRFEEISPDQWRVETRSSLPEIAQDWILGYWEMALNAPEPVLPDVAAVLGRPATPLLEWARDHREDFA